MKWLKKQDQYHNTYLQNIIIISTIIILTCLAFWYITGPINYFAGDYNFKIKFGIK